MDRRKQLKLAVLCGFTSDHEIFRENDATAETAKLLIEGTRLEKEDLFKKTSSGKIIFEYAGAWNNFDSLVNAVREDGGDVSFEDFKENKVSMQSMWMTKTIVKLAVEMNRVEKLFGPALWKDRPDSQMFSAWFELDNSDRTKGDFTAMRRSVAHARGQELRDDQLQKYNISTTDLRNAIREKKVGEISAKLAEHGDHLRKTDLFLPDSAGDHMVDTQSAWEGFPDLWEDLVSHGEILEPNDFLRRAFNRKSMVEEADRVNMLSMIFNARVWQGRSSQMLDLYKKMPENLKGKVRTENLLDDIADLDYSHKLKIDSTLDRDRLTAVLNKNDRAADGEHHPVRGLGLKTVWDNIQKVRDILHGKGQSIALTDLRMTSGHRDEPCLRLAASFGHFGTVLDILSQNGERLSVADLTAKGADDRSVLSVLAARNEEKLILNPANWVGRGHEFLEVWQALPDFARNRNDFPSLQSRINLLTVRQNTPPRRAP